MIWLSGLAFVAVAVVLALGGMLLVRRSVALSALEEHKEVAGFVYAVIGVIYAVLLAFVVIVVWEQQEEARVRVEQEANAVADLARGAQVFPAPVQAHLRGALRGYLETVLRDEWPGMSEGRTRLDTWRQYDRVWQTYREFRPRTAHEARCTPSPWDA